MHAIVFAFAIAVAAQGASDWSEPFPAHKIIGTVYYVGSKDLASYLITTPEGHLLINSGFERTVPLIQKSVESLGFKMTDVKILLASHAHSDHVAGLARLQKITGAKVFIMRGDDLIVASGGVGQYLYTTSRWEPCKVDRVLEDHDEVKLGGVTLVARLTPGHTRGCTTWTWRVDEGSGSGGKNMMSSSSAAPTSTLDTGWPTTPIILKSQPTSPGHSRCSRACRATCFSARTAATTACSNGIPLLKKGNAHAFVNPEGYKAYVAQKEAAFHRTLGAQRRKAELKSAR